MAVSITFATGFSGSGVQVNGQNSVTVSAESGLIAKPTVPAAVEGTLTTRTNNTSGEITVASGHGITTGDRVDLYWDNDDGTQGKCYGATVGTVTSTAIPIASVVGGDNLPAAESTIYIGKTVEVPFNFDAADLQAIIWQSTTFTGYIVLGDGTYDLVPKYVAPSTPSYWHTQLADTNPLDGEVPTVAFISHRETSSADDLQVVATITNS